MRNELKKIIKERLITRKDVTCTHEELSNKDKFKHNTEENPLHDLEEKKRKEKKNEKRELYTRGDFNVADNKANISTRVVPSRENLERTKFRKVLNHTSWWW